MTFGVGVVEIVGDGEGVRLPEFDILEVEVAEAEEDDEEVEISEETGDIEVTEVTVVSPDSTALLVGPTLLLAVTLSA